MGSHATSQVISHVPPIRTRYSAHYNDTDLSVTDWCLKDRHMKAGVYKSLKFLLVNPQSIMNEMCRTISFALRVSFNFVQESETWLTVSSCTEEIALVDYSRSFKNSAPVRRRNPSACQGQFPDHTHLSHYSRHYGWFCTAWHRVTIADDIVSCLSLFRIKLGLLLPRKWCI